MSLACCDCGLSVARNGTRGPFPKRCDACQVAARRARKKRRRTPRDEKDWKACACCQTLFSPDRLKQKYCCRDCVHLGQRKRMSVQCAHAGCGNTFTATPSAIAKGARCCSRQCKHALMRNHECLCQNPACKKTITRESPGTRKRALGRDYMKYCCSGCYHDHRWGASRPRRLRSLAHNRHSSASALQTSLRKKCKLLNVPNDEACTRYEVCARDNWICQICRLQCNREYRFDSLTRRVDPRNAEHDHIIPLTAKNSPGNVFPNSQCLCRKCNNKKSDCSRGQLRLDLEGSVKRWESGARGRRQQSSRFSGATLAAGL